MVAQTLKDPSRMSFKLFAVYSWLVRATYVVDRRFLVTFWAVGGNTMHTQLPYTVILVRNV